MSVLSQGTRAIQVNTPNDLLSFVSYMVLMRCTEISAKLIRGQVGYGLMESTDGCFRPYGQEGTKYSGSAGRLVAGSEAKIVDLETGIALPPDSPEKIWIRGKQIMKGTREKNCYAVRHIQIKEKLEKKSS